MGDINLKTEEQMDIAKAALEKADAQELFELFKTAVEKRDEVLKALEVVVSHYLGDKNEPRYGEPSDSVITAMERVALAAIELARDVSMKHEGQGYRQRPESG